VVDPAASEDSSTGQVDVLTGQVTRGHPTSAPGSQQPPVSRSAPADAPDHTGWNNTGECLPPTRTRRPWRSRGSNRSTGSAPRAGGDPAA